MSETAAMSVFLAWVLLVAWTAPGQMRLRSLVSDGAPNEQWVQSVSRVSRWLLLGVSGAIYGGLVAVAAREHGSAGAVWAAAMAVAVTAYVCLAGRSWTPRTSADRYLAAFGCGLALGLLAFRLTPAWLALTCAVALAAYCLVRGATRPRV